jgi:hypothetical protein
MSTKKFNTISFNADAFNEPEDFAPVDDDGGGEDDYLFGHEGGGDGLSSGFEETPHELPLLTADQIEDQDFVDCFMSDVNCTTLDSRYIYPKISIMVSLRMINEET